MPKAARKGACVYKVAAMDQWLEEVARCVAEGDSAEQLEQLSLNLGGGCGSTATAVAGKGTVRCAMNGPRRKILAQVLLRRSAPRRFVRCFI